MWRLTLLLLLAAAAVRAGPACKGGEPKEYKGQKPRAASSGTCQERAACKVTPTESRNGATGCEKEPASVVCCSENPCDDGGQSTEGQASQAGFCATNKVCAGLGKHSESDTIYKGTATGCVPFH